MSPRCTLSVALALLLAAGITHAAAQKREAAARSLFSAAPDGTPRGEIMGMRPETVGAVAYVSLSSAAADSLRARSNAPHRMQIALPGGGSVTCLLRPAARPNNMVVLSGVSVGARPGGRCSLVVDGSRVTGEIAVGAERYRLQPAGSGAAHAVVEVKTEAFPNENDPPRLPDNVRRASAAFGGTTRCDVKPRPGQRPKAFGPLRVMFLYTAAVGASTPNIRADIELIMQQLRTAWSVTNTGGNFSVAVELAHVQEIDYAQEEKMGKDLDRLTDLHDPAFRTVHALRDRHRAHLVHLLIKGNRGDGCGVGWLDPELRPKYAFSVSDRQCAVSVYTAVHEIGHNLGMNHDRHIVKDGKPGPAAFNFGFVAMQQGVRSLMAYSDECVAAKKSCPRELYFSSPNIQVKGVPFGRPLNDKAAAYNLEMLCRSAPIVSRHR